MADIRQEISTADVDFDKLVQDISSRSDIQWTPKNYGDKKRFTGARIDPDEVIDPKSPPPALNMPKIILEAKGFKSYQSTAGSKPPTGRKVTSSSSNNKDLDLHQYSVDEAIVHAVALELATLPAKVDWRDWQGRNAVTSVKNQGDCNSCVAFATAATAESMLIIEKSKTVNLSEADIYICGGGESCPGEGMYPYSGPLYLRDTGVVPETCFPYRDPLVQCKYVCANPDSFRFRITRYVKLSSVAERKQYLATVGPVMAQLVMGADLLLYGSGVYTPSSEALVASHEVQCIGYDDDEGCWILKNSWGPSWGEKGFFRVAYGAASIQSFPMYGMSGVIEPAQFRDIFAPPPANEFSSEL